jgi:hypothetical protein
MAAHLKPQESVTAASFCVKQLSGDPETPRIALGDLEAAECLWALAARMEPNEAALVAADPALAKTLSVSNVLFGQRWLQMFQSPRTISATNQYYSRLLARLESPDLAELLKQPLYVGPVRRLVLDELEKRHKRRFSDQWDFVRFAKQQHPELDLTTPPRRPDQANSPIALRQDPDRWIATVLLGKAKPADDAERVELAKLCQMPSKRLYVAATRFYAEAFANDARLADDLQTSNRYNAACTAALAGCGQGKDANKIDDKERARLRRQAMVWLRADLAHWTKQAESDKPMEGEAVQAKMKHWQADTDFAGVRDKDALEKLPAEERDAWQKLWDDVAALLAKTRDQK